MHDLFAIHHSVLTAIQSLAFILNLLLAYVVMRCSSGTLRSYREVFMITCVNDLLLGGIAFVCQPMGFYNGEVNVMYANGFVPSAAPSLVYWLMVLYVSGLMANTAFLPMPFLYRYYSICRAETSGALKKLIIVPTIAALIGFFTSSIMLRNDSEFLAEAVVAVEKISGFRVDSIQFSSRMVGLLNRPGELRMYPQLILSGGVIVATYVAIIWSEYKVMRKLRLLRPSMRPSTRRVHTDVHNALVALGICPMLTMLIPRSLSLIGFAFHVNMGLVPSLLGILMTSVTLLNPITTCYFVRPFRTFIVRMFCCVDATHSSPSSSLPTLTNRVQDIASVARTAQ